MKLSYIYRTGLCKLTRQWSSLNGFEFSFPTIILDMISASLYFDGGKARPLLGPTSSLEKAFLCFLHKISFTNFGQVAKNIIRQQLLFTYYFTTSLPCVRLHNRNRNTLGPGIRTSTVTGPPYMFIIHTDSIISTEKYVNLEIVRTDSGAALYISVCKCKWQLLDAFDQ